MRFPIRHVTVPSWTFAEALLSGKPKTIHFLRLSRRLAIVWDRKDRK